MNNPKALLTVSGVMCAVAASSMIARGAYAEAGAVAAAWSLIAAAWFGAGRRRA